MQRTQELYVEDKNKRFRPSGRMAKQILENEKELCDAIKDLARNYKKVEEIVEEKRDELLTLLCHIEPQYNAKGKKLTAMIITGAVKYVIKTLCESDEHLHNIRKSMHRSQQGGKGIDKDEAKEKRIQMSHIMLEGKSLKPWSEREERKHLEKLFESFSESPKSLSTFQTIADDLNKAYHNKRTAKAIKAYYHRRKKTQSTSSQNPPGPPLAGPSAASEVGGNQSTANADVATQSSAPVE